MDVLSPTSQQRARAFVMTHARPLERAIYAVEFEDGPVDAVWSALAAFQNADGGFGHALEPDFRIPASSALATTTGLQVLREYGAPSSHPLVEGSMSYLLATYDAANQVWPIIPPYDAAIPHAPWWGYSDDTADGWGGYRFNPTAEVVGYLHDYADLVPDALRGSLTDVTLMRVERAVDEMQVFDLHCCARLVATTALPPAARERLQGLLSPVVDRLVVTDASEWHKYVMAPLELIDGPDAPFADRPAAAVQENLDYVVAHQAASGAWEPAWTWGPAFPEVWPKAKAEWAGVITIRMLKILKRFGRLEG